MLKEQGIDFRYREYTKEPLSETELREVFAKLGLGPKDLLRSRDAKKAGLTGKEADDNLLLAMVDNPRLLQRPIYVLGEKAVLGRPVERLFEILE